MLESNPPLDDSVLTCLLSGLPSVDVGDKVSMTGFCKGDTKDANSSNFILHAVCLIHQSRGIWELDDELRDICWQDRYMAPEACRGAG